MTQAAESSNLSAVVMLTVYWVLLIAWDLVFPPHASGKAGRSVAGNARQSVTQASAPTRTTLLLRQNDPSFDEAAFLRHACLSYEAILQAYAEGDADTLAPLVGQEVLDVFARCAADRRARNVTLELALVALRKAEMVRADVRENTAEISVRFVSELFSVSRSTDGEIVAGNARQIVLTADLWTFEYDLRSGTSSWRLIATEAG